MPTCQPSGRPFLKATCSVRLITLINAALLDGELVRHNCECECRVLLASILSLRNLLQIGRRSFSSQDPCLILSDLPLEIGEGGHQFPLTETILQTN